MNIIARFREQHPAVPFVFAVSRGRLKTDCSRFALITTIDQSQEWGYRAPGCNQNDYVNRYALDHSHLLGCLECPLYESTGKEITQVIGYSDLDKKAKRKLRREARKKRQAAQ